MAQDRSTLGRSVLVLFGALAMILYAASERAVATTLTVGLSQPTYSFVPLDIAIQKDLCRPYDLQLHKLEFHGSAQLHQAITGGSVDIGLGAGPELGFLAKGAPEKAVAAMSDQPADLAIVVLKDGPIHTVADLKGKRASMSTPGSLTEWAARELSRKEGWGNDGINLVALGSFTAQTAALKTHQIDAMVVEAGTAARLEEAGTGRTLLRFTDIVPHFHIHVIYASDSVIAEKPEAVRGFLACWFDAVNYMRAHRAESVAIAAKSLDMSPAVSGQLYDQLVPYYNRTGRFDPQALDTIAQALVEMGDLPAKPDLTPYVTERFLPPPS
jgi:NitT/TauT family transport system substrate-binding protein